MNQTASNADIPVTEPGLVREMRVGALALLFLVSFFNYMDRYMLAVLLPAIKADLALSDTQIGLITGLAFTLFYATLGIPIARLADRYSRRKIIAIALAFWSVMTAVCGFTQSFLQLLLARVFVGAGEAGASPPSHSLISDLFPARERARALSVFSLGAPVGILVGFALGGWLVERYSWRIALFMVAVPGLLLAVVAWRRLPDPPRGGTDGLTTAPALQPLWLTFRTLMGTPSFRQVSIATGLYTVLWLGVVQWLPSFFTRSFDLGMGQVSLVLALVLSSSQIIGMLVGGALADRLGRRDLRWYLWLPAIAILISTPAFAVTFTTASATLAYASLFLPFMIGIVQGPATFAVVQGVADVSMRATAAALLLLITNLIGGGIGPYVVGALSDLLLDRFGVDSLRYSLLLVALFFGTWSSLHYFLGARSLRADFKSQM
jgi:MFS family permease